MTISTAEKLYDAIRKRGEGHTLNMARAKADKQASIFTDAWYSAVVREYAKLNVR